MREFQHVSSALRLFHGGDCLRQLPSELGRVNSRRAAVICGRTLAAEGSVLSLVLEALGDRCAGVFNGVRAHSPVEAVQRASEALAEMRADAVVAVGGGSAIVTARAASILLAEQASVRELSTRRGVNGRLISPKLMAPKLPQFVVLTTPTTACVKAGSAVFDPATRQRLAMYDPKTRAQALFIHPQMALSSAAQLALTASFNTLAMAVEGLESEASDPLSDAMLMHALRLLGGALPLLPGNQANASVRSDLMLAAVLCGQGTDQAGGGIASVLAHAIGARCEVENGLLNAILLPHTMRFNAPATRSRISKVASSLGGSDRATGEDAAARVETFLADLPGPRRLRDAGVPREALLEIASAAFDDWFLQRNPRPVTDQETLTDLLQTAW